MSDLTGTLDINNFSNTTLEGYAVPGDEDTYTVHAEGAKPDGLTAYGHVSAWLIVALPVVLLSAFVVYRVNRRRGRP